MGARLLTDPPPSKSPRGPCLFVFVREDERQTLRAAAKAAGAPNLSQWVRKVCKAAARQELARAA